MNSLLVMVSASLVDALLIGDNPADAGPIRL